MSEIKQLYQQLLPTGGFLLDNGNSKTEENQFCYALSPDKGKGVFWQYFFENMFRFLYKGIIINHNKNRANLH